MLERYPSVSLNFVRHAQARAEDGSYDANTPLSALGKRQAVLTAERLSRCKVVYASPSPRCLQTAEPLCSALKLSPQVDNRLREFEFDSVTLSNVLTRPDLVMWESHHQGLADGETLQEFSDRVATFVGEIAEKHLGADVAVFTHCGVIDAAIRWLVGLPSHAPWLHDFPLTTASITEVEFWPRGRIAGGSPRYAAFLRIGDSHLGEHSADF